MAFGLLGRIAIPRSTSRLDANRGCPGPAGGDVTAAAVVSGFCCFMAAGLVSCVPVARESPEEPRADARGALGLRSGGGAVVAIDFVARAAPAADSEGAPVAPAPSEDDDEDDGPRLGFADDGGFCWFVARPLLLLLLLTALRLVRARGARDRLEPPSKAVRAVDTSSDERLRQNST